MINPVLDPAVTAIAGQLREMASRIQQLERNQRSGYNLANASVSGGLTITTPDGTPVLSVGAQSDGTFAARQIATVVPPGAASTPVVSSGINGLYVAWDGLMASGATPPYDYSATQVHASPTPNFTPGPSTLMGHMVGAGLFGIGGLAPGTTYYVTFVVLNGVGDAGPPSIYTSGVPVSVPAGIPPGSISGLQIQTGTITAQQIAAAAGILGSQISTGTITSANILAGTITAALLAAGIVVAGIVDATMITGSTLRNSATDPKTSINPDGSISITNIHGTVIFQIAADGTVDWFSQGGELLMELQPGGTQLIYASLTGPAGWDFEPPGPPQLLFSASSATSATTYANAPVTATTLGNCITVAASASGTNASTGVTDTQGNVYTLIQSVTTAPTMQVWQCTGAFPLGTSDTITVQYGTADTTEKNFIALATPGVLTASVVDFSSKANATSTSPSASGTPANYGDCLLFFVTNATGGGAPSAITDGWTQVAQQNVAGQQWTTVWSSSNVTGFSQSATATITSSAWSAVMLALKASPATPIATFPIFGANSNLAVSTAWAGDGSNSLKITHNNTTANWGATFPAFTVQPGTTVSMQAQVYTPTALSAVSIGFTFWSGPNGTGSNLGTVSGDQGTLSTGAGAVNQVSITGATVPANAASATFFVNQGAADAVNTVYYVDAIAVPGGLVYSNSPTGGTDKLGNPFEQGINFIGLPGQTNIFGVEDPFGSQLLAIDAGGNIQAQTVSAAKDIQLAGQSLAATLTAGPQALLNYGFMAVGGTAWPSTAIGTTEVALFELDQAVVAGRVYEFVMNPTIINTSGALSAHMKLRYTTDGTTPTTSSTTAATMASRVETANSDAHIGPLRCLFFPTADGTYRFLVTGFTGSGTYQFKNDNFIRCAVYDWGPNDGQGSNNALVVLGSGSSGGNTPQTYTEHFFPSNTWSYYSGSGQRNHNGSLYHGAYSGENDYQYGYIQWGTGDLGNALNTVLNYSVSKVSLRVTNLHSWYNNGMTLGVHTSTSLGGAQGTYSVILTSMFISEGNTFDYTLGTTVWNPFKAGGTTYMVLAPDSGNLHNLNWYGYFYGKGADTTQEPRLTVTYTH